MMEILINHCWCSDSNWGGYYDCSVILTIKAFEKREDVYKRKYTPDWQNVLDEHYSNTIDEVMRLKPTIIQWLNDNVKDREDDEHKKGWSVGTDEYNKHSGISFSLFFARRNDAMKFIKHWSIYKNPVHYLNYFKDIRRELDFTTGRMTRVPR